MVRDEAMVNHALTDPGNRLLSDEVREQIQRMHDDIRNLGLNDVPFYPDEVMTREWIYGDHP